MPVYRVSGRVTVSAWTIVEADTPEAAMKAANDREAVLAQNGWESSGCDPAETAIIEDGDGSLQAIEAYPASKSDMRAWRDYHEEEEG